MKIWDDLLANTDYVWNNWGLRTLSIGLIKNVAKTVYYFGTQVLAMPDSIKNMGTQEPVKKVVSHLGLILYENVMPIVAVGTGNDLLQYYMHQSKTQPDHLMSASFVLKSSLFVMSSGIEIYLFYKKRDMALRQTVVALEAAKHFPSIQDDSFKELCKKDNCTVKRQIGGLARQVVVRSVVDRSLDKLGTLPYARIPAEIIRIQHDGTYIVTQILPLCDRHLTAYTGSNPELVWSAGTLNWLLTQTGRLTIATLVGLPLRLFFSGLGYDANTATVFAFILAHQLTEMSKPALRLLTAYIVSNTKLPAPEEKGHDDQFNPLRSVNPLMWYFNFLSFCADTVAIGLNKTLPKLLPEKKEPLRLNKVVDKIRHVVEHPILYKQYPWALLPKKYQSKENFVRIDPILKDNWHLLRAVALDYMYAYEKIRNIFSGGIYVAKQVPMIPAGAVWLIKGLPPEVSKLVISLIANHQVNMLLGDVRRLFEGLHTNETSLDLPQDFQTPLKLPDTLPEVKEENTPYSTLLIKSIDNVSHAINKIAELTPEQENTLEEEKKQLLCEQEFIKGSMSISSVSVFNTVLNKQEPEKSPVTTLAVPSKTIDFSQNSASLFNTVLKKESPKRKSKKQEPTSNDSAFLTTEELTFLMIKGGNNRKYQYN